MKHESVTEEVQERAALYALGAFNQIEAKAFELHLQEGCATCRQEVAGFEAVTSAVGLSANEASPPAYLRDLLASRIEKEAQAPANVIPFPEQNAKAPRAAEARASRRPAILPWAVAALLAIAMLFGLRQWQVERRNAQALIAEQSRSQATIAELQDQLDETGLRAQQLEQINEALASSGARVIELAGQQVAPQASGKIYWNTQEGRWIVRADLPPPPEGKTYQLWFVTSDARISAGLMQPDESGRAFAVVSLPPGLDRLAAAAITLEPQGGSPQPTMPIYALGAIS